MNKHNYTDKHGNKIEAEMRIRHNNGDVELVLGDKEEIGLNATNPNYRGNEFPKIYPLSEFNLKEWEIVYACPDCEGDTQVMDWADDMWGNTKSFWRQCDCCEGEGYFTSEKEWKEVKEIYPKPNSFYRKQYGE